MPQDVQHHTFPNGLTLLAERMEHVRSAAFLFLVPAGCVYDPPEHLGLASVLADLITRGAGARDSRALTTALDNLGGTEEKTRQFKATMAVAVPLGRLGQSDEIAKVAVFLASDDAAWVTGERLTVSGGYK